MDHVADDGDGHRGGRPRPAIGSHRGRSLGDGRVVALRQRDAVESTSTIRSSDHSRFSRVTQSGGASRIVDSWVSFAQDPAPHQTFACRARGSRAGLEVDRRSRARGRGSRSPGAPPHHAALAATRRRARRTSVDRSLRGADRITSTPIAHASGLPPNVEPCSPGLNTPSTSRSATTADNGTMPPPSALPRMYTSGTTPRARPRTSSRFGRAPTGSRRPSAARRARVQSSRAARR